jgi:hypothetical protein
MRSYVAPVVGVLGLITRMRKLAAGIEYILPLGASVPPSH